MNLKLSVHHFATSLCGHHTHTHREISGQIGLIGLTTERGRITGLTCSYASALALHPAPTRTRKRRKLLSLCKDEYTVRGISPTLRGIYASPISHVIQKVHRTHRTLRNRKAAKIHVAKIDFYPRNSTSDRPMSKPTNSQKP